MQGKGSTTVRFITFYCLNTPSSKGTGSAFAKQVKFFEDRGRTADPREKIPKDLKELIKECKKNGEHIFLIGDLNEYIHLEQMQKFCSETGIKITEGGYFPLHFGYKSDHRLLWVKFLLEYILGSIEHPL
eukprot:10874147-Ditylum_brightwellii.AAC.1